MNGLLARLSIPGWPRAAVATFVLAVPGCGSDDTASAASATVDHDGLLDHDALLGEWLVDEGVGLEIDASGFELPTAMAFVPEPGPLPGDPLYFVAELEGTIRVVTNDRTVHRFATVPVRELPRHDLRGSGQTGLAGLCIDPMGGSIFATYTYPDERGVLRNGMARFDTGVPRTLTTAPAEQTRFDHIFRDAQSAPPHQIGQCVVDGDRVFAGVGDGGNVSAAGNLDILLGKIVCLTTEGHPCPDNPFLSDSLDPEPRDFVWAYGFRNPFALAMAGGFLFAAENGLRTDRFLRVVRGGDHFWDGTDASISAGADLLLPDAPSPVQMAFVSEDRPGLPPSGAFVFSIFHEAPRTGVMVLDYDFDHMRTSGPVRYAIEYAGAGEQYVLATAVGPDGIYAATAFPEADGTTHVYRATYGAPTPHWRVIGSERTGEPVEVLERHGCLSCHPVDGTGEAIGPSLDGFGLAWRLTERLNAPEYETAVAAVDELDAEPFVSYREARRHILEVEGRDRTRRWLRTFLEEPRFDDPTHGMPNPDLSEEQIVEVTEALAAIFTSPSISLTDRGIRFAVRYRRELAVGYVLGVVSAALLLGVLVLAVRLRSEDGAPEPTETAPERG